LKLYRWGTIAFGVVFVGLGISLLVATARAGGGAGYLFGALFILLGIGRVYLLVRR
jgi:hypothetical protein